MRALSLFTIGSVIAYLSAVIDNSLIFLSASSCVIGLIRPNSLECLYDEVPLLTSFTT